jgi:Glycosyl transferases group 1
MSPRAGRSSSDQLARERARADAASDDANRAERELLAAQAEVRRLEAKLATTERRLDALGRRAAVRVSDGVLAGMRALRTAVGKRSRSRGSDGDLGPGVARSFEGVSARDLPRHYRETLLAALAGEAGIAPFTVVPFGPMDEVVAGLQARGVVATRDQDGADAIIVTDARMVPDRLPEAPIRIGVHPATDPGFDVVVGPSDDPVGALIDQVERWLRATRVGIRIPAPHPGAADAWGDTHFARAFRDALRRAGWEARTRLRYLWDRPFVGVDDVVLDLLGLHTAASQPGAVRILWQISHPELARPALYDRYDAVFVASDSFAERMAPRVSVPVLSLHQATDPKRFQPTPGGPAHELLFVGGWRQAGRRVLEDLLPTDHELAVYGGRWTPERIDPRHLGGAAVPNADLPAYYSGASIVLNDHWAAMRREGFLSNRLYDAAAAGAFVISDRVEGMDEEFDGGIVGYRDRDDLRALVDRFLADPDARREHADRARKAVLDRHTFDHRARRFIEAVEPLLAARRSAS